MSGISSWALCDDCIVKYIPGPWLLSVGFVFQSAPTLVGVRLMIMQEGNTSLNVVTENYFMCRILNTLTSLAILMTESHAQFCCKSLCYIMLFKLRNKKCLILQSGLTDIRSWYRCAAERCMIRIVLILIGNIFCSNKVTAELQCYGPRGWRRVYSSGITT